MKYPLVTIIISNYNGHDLGILSSCLKSFVKNDYPNFELLLIDNASSDNSVKTANKIFGKSKRFKVIQNSVNLYSKGVNMGFRAAKGEYIALFNNDVETGKDYIKKLVLAFKKYKNLAIVQGKFMWYDDKTIIDSAGETMDIYGNPVTLGYHSKDNGQFDSDEEILSASGAACVIKKSALDDVGIYDDKFGIGYEDMDLSLRLLHKKYKIYRIYRAVCYHKRGVTDLSPMVRVKVRWHFNKNRLSTMIRNYPMPLLLRSLPVTVAIYIGNMFWEIMVLKNIPLGLTRIKAIAWIVVNLPEVLKQRMLIRKGASSESDKKILKLLAKPDLFGKAKAVIADKFKFASI